MRGTLETIVGAMFAGKTSELLKRILWAEHQGKKILVLSKDKYKSFYENSPNIHNESDLSEIYSISKYLKKNGNLVKGQYNLSDNELVIDYYKH